VSFKIKAIHAYEGEIRAAYPGDAITVTLEDEVDISRGDTLVHSHAVPTTGRHFNAHLVWLHENALVPGREYLIKLGARTTQAVVRKVHEEININELTRQAEIGRASCRERVLSAVVAVLFKKKRSEREVLVMVGVNE